VRAPLEHVDILLINLSAECRERWRRCPKNPVLDKFHVKLSADDVRVESADMHTDLTGTGREASRSYRGRRVRIARRGDQGYISRACGEAAVDAVRAFPLITSSGTSYHDAP
jgi:hypothetical protein